jgi:hypothetical protein
MDPGTYVIYKEGHKVQPKGIELAKREASYFNRGLGHFCSHQHTPNSGVTEGSAITVGSQGAYISWSVFTEYREMASLILRDLVCATLDTLLGDNKTLQVGLPAQGVTTLMDQKSQSRLVHHLLYATPVKRGNGIEVIEDIVPIYNIDVTVRQGKSVKRIYLAPQMTEIPFMQKDGVVSYTVEKVDNHQMVVLEY